MGVPLQTNNPVIVSAFKSSLLHQSLVVLAILALLAVAWIFLRSAQLERASKGDLIDKVASVSPEPVARRVLRIGFGLIWIFDGILQGQSSMPLGLVPQVIQPTEAGSPHWLQSLVNSGVGVWSNHPIEAAVSAVWIQVGIGVWLLVAPRGRLSRLGGLASCGWGVIVWIFGESLGGILAPGLSWMFGAPGAAVFYFVAGALLALPEGAWAKRVLGRAVLCSMGLFFVGMAVLQAWPANGFWHGHVHTASGTAVGPLVSMAQSMAATPQPSFLSRMVLDFGTLDDAHGFAVNLVVVVVLGAIGIALFSNKPAVIRWAILATVVICIADWVLIEDFGFLGGLGTDPNSMIPMALFTCSGYLAYAHAPETVVARTKTPGLFAPGFLRRVNPTYALRALAAFGAIVVVVLGAAPMAVASLNNQADPIIANATDGTPDVVDMPAPNFSLIDQNGHVVTLKSLRGKIVALTFLDPVCTADCPVIAQEFRQTDGLLGGNRRRVELLAVVANPIDRSLVFTNAFDRQEGLDRLGNWLYLTGSVPQLTQVWDSFGVQVSIEPAGAMIAHSDIAYVIDSAGTTRFINNADPGPGTTVSQSSFSGELTSEIEQLLR